MRFPVRLPEFADVVFIVRLAYTFWRVLEFQEFPRFCTLVRLVLMPEDALR